MAVKKNKTQSKIENKSYLAKDFESFRNELTAYARNYFISQNADFSEASLGGMFVELAAYVGDSMSYFLDHQFNELDPSTATSRDKILNHARNHGVKPIPASPAVVNLKFFIEVPSQNVDGVYVPQSSALPVVREGTTCTSTQGPTFTTAEDLDFSEVDIYGNLLAASMVSQRDSSGNPSAFILSREVLSVSGRVEVQTIRVAGQRPFLTINLSQPNVTEILSVKDKDGNDYYEVDFLSQNTVFKKSKNLSNDQVEVSSNLEIVSAGRRYIRDTDFNTLTTTLRFGGGDESQPDDDIIPDPSELAIPLYGRNTFSRFSIDPKNLLRTQTLGISPANTIITVTYRYGGGSDHNVDAGTITSIDSLSIDFPGAPSPIVSSNIVQSIDVRNDESAGGGARAPTLDELRDLMFTSRNMQSRMVTQDDLLARLYSLPSQFGRVYRASIKKSTRNPMASELYVLSLDRQGNLTTAPDTLKKNLSLYLNEFRLISDAIDVLDAIVVNYGIEFSIVVTPGSNKATVTQKVIRKLQKIVDKKFYQIDQPLIEADFINEIISTPEVLSMPEFRFFNRTGEVSGTVYSNYVYDLEKNKFKGMIVGPPASMFEMLNPGNDIIGSAE